MIRVISENSTTVYSKKWYKLIQIGDSDFFELYVLIEKGDLKQITTLRQSGSYFVDTKTKEA
jgi:stalled ribosome rescue protein Dom34